MRTEESLFDALSGGDSAYSILRIRPDLEDARAFILELWRDYKDIADRNFVTAFREDVFSRTWEMYLACACREAGLKVDRRRSGPDVVVETGDGRIAIEATAPGGGQNLAWPLDFSIGSRLPPDENILPRFTGAVQGKAAEFEDDLAKGRLRPDDIRVIAINTIKVPYARSVEGPVPRPVKAVYPIDECEIEWGEGGRFWVVVKSSRRQITTPSGSPISTSVFCDGDLTEVSAVVFSQAWPPDRRRPLGYDVIVAHNREAVRPLPHGFWPHGLEFWYEGDRLCGKSHEPGARTLG